MNKPCRACGGPKSKGRGRAYCDGCAPHCGDHEIRRDGCVDCAYASKLRAQRKIAYSLSEQDVIALESIKECEVCGSTVKLCVDHDHETGRVRGILCSNCNVALGLLRDDPDTLRALTKYIDDRMFRFKGERY